MEKLRVWKGNRHTCKGEENAEQSLSSDALCLPSAAGIRTDKMVRCLVIYILPRDKKKYPSQKGEDTALVEV